RHGRRAAHSPTGPANGWSGRAAPAASRWPTSPIALGSVQKGTQLPNLGVINADQPRAYGFQFLPPANLVQIDVVLHQVQSKQLGNGIRFSQPVDYQKEVSTEVLLVGQPGRCRLRDIGQAGHAPS